MLWPLDGQPNHARIENVDSEPANWWRCHNQLVAGWSSPVAREAHNLEVAGSNPVPANSLGCGVSGLSAAVALVTLARRRRSLGLSPAVHRQGAAEIIALLEPPRRVAADEPFVGARVDEFPAGRLFRRRLLSC